MEEDRRKSTIFYIFCTTLLPQILFLAVFFSVGAWAWWSYRYNAFLLSICGAMGFIAMLFLLICIAVLHHAYTPRLLEDRRGEFRNWDAAPIREIRYWWGRKSTLTGKRPLYISEREKKSGAPFLLLVLEGLTLALTGGIQFVIEVIRGCRSADRAAVWNECENDMEHKVAQEGVKSFFKVPVCCLAIVVALWVVLGPLMLYYTQTYSEDRLEFCITEKLDEEYNGRMARVYLNGAIRNRGFAKIQTVEGRLCCYDRQGGLLCEGKVLIREPSSVTARADPYLEHKESWNISLYLVVEGEAAAALWESELDDIKITMDVLEIRYKGDRYIEFPGDRQITVKPYGEK